MSFRITKPVESLTGDNYGIVKMKIGRIHCCTPPREAIREVRSTIKNWKAVPRELRRGFILCCLETLAANRDTFRYVMTGR